MDHTREIRRQLVSRLVLITLAAAGSAAACGSDVNTPAGQGGAGGTGGVISDGSYDGQECFVWPQQGTGGGGGSAGGGGGGGGSASGSGGGSASGSGGGSASGSGGAGGVMVPIACPSMADAAMYMPNLTCGGMVLSGGTLADGQCCYNVHHYGCITGRPYVVSGHAQTAPRAKRSDWVETFAPDLLGLSDAERATLADAWAQDGFFEHASVASFGRFAMELLAVGAPPELVELAHQAALDEIKHARLCLTLASAYSGAKIGPGGFPFAGQVEVSADLATVAARVVLEGCVNETLASLVAAEQLARAEDNAVRSVLSVITEDEAKHAELAWKTIAWAVQTGGTEVRAAVAAAFEEALAGGNTGFAFAAGNAVLEKHGRPAESEVREVMRRGLAEVVRPAFEALMGRSGNAVS